MRLTKKKAIEDTLEMWIQRAETGSMILVGCPLCRYAKTKCDGCECCPYFKKFHASCLRISGPYPKWYHARTIEDCKKYALEIVEKVKQLK